MIGLTIKKLSWSLPLRIDVVDFVKRGYEQRPLRLGPEKREGYNNVSCPRTIKFLTRPRSGKKVGDSPRNHCESPNRFFQATLPTKTPG